MRFSFDENELETDRRELRRKGELVAVEPQVFDLLVYLLQNRDRVVSKDDLIASIWRGRIVSDSTIASHIHAARRAIGDAGSAQRLIRTVPRKGVRFVGVAKAMENQTGAYDMTEPTRLELNDKPSIAVLPFANLSSDPEQEHFAYGMVEDIITALSRFPSLFVAARTSSFTYRDGKVSAKQIGHELGVRYMLEGSLRKSGNRIRITGQLVEADTGNHVWAERYDRDLADIFTVQDEITEAVTIAIAPAIADAERKRAMRKPPESVDAWVAYQRGFWHLANSTAQNALTAERFFRQAVDLDTNFIGGYAGLALTFLDLGWVWGIQTMPAAQAAAEEWIRRGLAVDGADAQARSVLAIALYMRGDYVGAEAEARTALALSPNLAEPHAVLGAALIFSGRPCQGLAALETCLRLDPRSPRFGIRLVLKAIGCYVSKDYEAAAITAAQAVRLYPKYPLPYRWLAAALGQLGRADEARRALKQAVAIAPDFFDRLVREGVPWMRPVDYKHMMEGLRKAGLQG